MGRLTNEQRSHLVDLFVGGLSLPDIVRKVREDGLVTGVTTVKYWCQKLAPDTFGRVYKPYDFAAASHQTWEKISADSSKLEKYRGKKRSWKSRKHPPLTKEQMSATRSAAALKWHKEKRIEVNSQPTKALLKR